MGTARKVFDGAREVCGVGVVRFVSLVRCLSILSVIALLLPAVAGDGGADPQPLPEMPEGCRWVEVRQPLPGEQVPQVIVDPDGCLRDAIRRAIGWG